MWVRAGVESGAEGVRADDVMGRIVDLPGFFRATSASLGFRVLRPVLFHLRLFVHDSLLFFLENCKLSQ